MLKALPSNKKDNTKSSKHSIDENKNQKPIYSFYKKIQGAEVEVTEFIENKIVSRSQKPDPCRYVAGLLLRAAQKYDQQPCALLNTPCFTVNHLTLRVYHSLIVEAFGQHFY